MIHYQLNEQACYDRINGQYVSYGITVVRGSRIIRVIEDISTDRAAVAALTDRYNAEQLSPAHLDEAVESFLYDFEV